MKSGRTGRPVRRFFKAIIDLWGCWRYNIVVGFSRERFKEKQQKLIEKDGEL